MKLIIDIPDEMYDCIKKDTESEMYIIDVIKKGTPYNLKGDLISRSDLKEKAYTAVILEPDEKGIDYVKGKRYVVDLEDIDNAPTVDLWEMRQEATENALKKAEVLYGRPQGKWIRKVDEVGFISHICSECGAEIEVEDCSDDKFCFNCGAKMQKGNKE